MRAPFTVVLGFLLAGCIEHGTLTTTGSDSCLPPAGSSAVALQPGTRSSVVLEGTGWARVPFRVCRTSWVRMSFADSHIEPPDGPRFVYAFLSPFEDGLRISEPDSPAAEFQRMDLPGVAAHESGPPGPLRLDAGAVAWLIVATNVPGYTVLLSDDADTLPSGPGEVHHATLTWSKGMVFEVPPPSIASTPSVKGVAETLEWHLKADLETRSIVYVVSWTQAGSTGVGVAVYDETFSFGRSTQTWRGQFVYPGTDGRVIRDVDPGDRGETITLDRSVKLETVGVGGPDVGVAWLVMPYA